MGGPGSGRWIRHDRKMTVEECACLDVKALVDLASRSCLTRGVLSWRDNNDPRESVNFAVDPVGRDFAFLRLSFIHGNRRRLQGGICLECRPQPIGGSRWWFRCPLIVDGSSCNRVVTKLYLRGCRFACRHCHDLTYTSSQQSHVLERLLVRGRRFRGGSVLPRRPAGV